jgi:hydroxymethylbilane synthase
MRALRIGSRGSQLALWQSNHIAGLLRACGVQVELQIIKTTGDKVLEVALSQVGTKGMFTREIEDALAAGEVDLAVHSLKDLPTELGSGFALAAITKREDQRDVFISQRYDGVLALPQGARVGTSSLRRQAQLKALRPDIEVIPLRGNVDTRMRKLAAGDFDAIILAAAGVNRLRLASEMKVCRPITPEQMCPAAGQGALAIEIRAGDTEVANALQFLDDADARATTTCERAMLQALGGGCQVPIGAYARRQGSAITLTGVVAQPDGSSLLREERSGAEPVTLGHKVAQALLARGADVILQTVHAVCAAAPQQP